MRIVSLEAQEWSTAQGNGLSQTECEHVVAKAAKKATEFLPTLSPHLNILIRAHAENAVPDIAVGGRTYDSELILLSFDQSLPFGKDSLLGQLTSTTYHEANHAARFAWIAKAKLFEKSLLDWAIWEGLATVCERDYGKTIPLWSEYGDDKTMHQWLADLKNADKKDDAWGTWAFKREDGRNWLAYKVGTWIVDRAITNSKQTVGELTTIPAQKILKLADIK